MVVNLVLTGFGSSVIFLATSHFLMCARKRPREQQSKEQLNGMQAVKISSSTLKTPVSSGSGLDVPNAQTPSTSNEVAKSPCKPQSPSNTSDTKKTSNATVDDGENDNKFKFTMPKVTTVEPEKTNYDSEEEGENPLNNDNVKAFLNKRKKFQGGSHDVRKKPSREVAAPRAKETKNKKDVNEKTAAPIADDKRSVMIESNMKSESLLNVSTYM